MNAHRGLIAVGPRPALLRARLVVCPHAGGASSGYRHWAGEFSGTGIGLDLFEYPGHGARMGEPPAADHKILVAELVEAIAADDVPTAILGHSMGSLIAFEAARDLSAMGMRPLHLFVSAARAPSTYRDRAVRDWTDGELTGELVRYGATPAALLEDGDVRAMLLGVLRNDYGLLDRYVLESRAPLPTAITAFYGTEDDSVPLDEIREWGDLTSAGFAMRPLSGGHFYDRAAIPRLCRTIARLLDV